MMEYMLKKSFGLTKNKRNIGGVTEFSAEKPSANCNICRNFANISDRSHRLSTSHQNKLTERFKVIRSKMKMITSDLIVVHDAEWNMKNEDLWCYFCDKSIAKNQIYKECVIESLGYLTHLADSQHMEAVKSYLKFHGRKEKCELFCKTKTDLEKFRNKIPEAEKKYVAKLDYLNQKDVAHIREIEVQRQLLVNEALEASVPVYENGTATENANQKVSTQPQGRTLSKNILLKPNFKISQKPKICPWLVQPEKECDDQQERFSEKPPIVGPTIDTLKKYVAHQKKKMLPAKRLGANFQRKQVYSSHWLPSFSGVWNKGRHRRMRMDDKHAR